jgi:hypothetical protein
MPVPFALPRLPYRRRGRNGVAGIENDLALDEIAQIAPELRERGTEPK